MNIKSTLIASALVGLLASASVMARPIVLPDPGKSTGESGSFKVGLDGEIILTGKPVSLQTSQPVNTDVASGNATFKTGSLNYNDGKTKVTGKLSRSTLTSQVTDGKVTYMLSGLVYGKLVQGSTHVDVNGNFSVATKPAPEGSRLDQVQVDSSHLVVTPRNSTNNKN
jgi:hypothetical protein